MRKDHLQYTTIEAIGLYSYVQFKEGEENAEAFLRKLREEGVELPDGRITHSFSEVTSGINPSNFIVGTDENDPGTRRMMDSYRQQVVIANKIRGQIAEFIEVVPTEKPE